jgi:NAD(P)-dependent dehydrogenase (short-subunit alcohol dehydrogenase family)
LSTPAPKADKGRRVFLTGASRGLGLATARLLSDRGCEVWGTSRDVRRLPHLPGFHPVALDLCDPESIATAVEEVWSEAGRLDVLVQNAACMLFGAIEEVPAEMAVRQWEVLVMGPLRVLHHALPRLRGQRGGLVIHVGSLASEFCVPFQAHYCAGKAAFGALTAGLAMELAPFGVRVVHVRPGGFDTNLGRATIRMAPWGSPYRRSSEMAWSRVEHDMREGASPEVMASGIWRIMQWGNPPPVVDLGGFFETVVAPTAKRLLPSRLLQSLNRQYYGL